MTSTDLGPDPEAGGTSGFVPLEEAARLLGYERTDWRAAARSLPVRWPAAYLALAATPEGAPIRRMGTPDPRELVPDAGDLPDPVGERSRSDTPFVVRKHRDRAILLVTARCHFYCRFCFRRSFPDGAHRDPTQAELDTAIAHLAADTDVEEVILSGGDPLVLSDERLAAILRALVAAPHVRRIRVHTRAPVHFPERVTDALADILVTPKPVRIVTHVNHPVEITPAMLEAVRRFQRRGLPVLDQSVLLAGVNDSADTLALLFTTLHAHGMQPYYLHHPDRVPGNAAFRVSIPHGMELLAEVRGLIPNEALPAYVIDLPDGSGKVPVESLVHLGAGRYRCPLTGTELDDVPEPAAAARR